MEILHEFLYPLIVSIVEVLRTASFCVTALVRPTINQIVVIVVGLLAPIMLLVKHHDFILFLHL